MKASRIKTGEKMGDFSHFISWISKKGVIVSAAFLIGIMAIIVANIAARICGTVIKGYIEVVQLLMVVTVAFAFGFTAIEKSHVVVDIVFSRFSPKVKAVCNMLTTPISMFVCGLIVWSSARITYQRALLNEQTDLLKIPTIPFRFIWVLGLIIFFLILLIDFVKTISEVSKK